MGLWTHSGAALKACDQGDHLKDYLRCNTQAKREGIYVEIAPRADSRPGSAVAALGPPQAMSVRPLTRMATHRHTDGVALPGARPRSRLSRLVLIDQLRVFVTTLSRG